MPKKGKEGRNSASLTAYSFYIYYYFISCNSVLKENSIQDQWLIQIKKKKNTNTLQSWATSKVAMFALGLAVGIRKFIFASQS